MEESEVLKTCPFLNKTCIGDKCELRISITQQKTILGVSSVAQTRVCTFTALNLVMSSLVTLGRTQQAPPQTVKLPGLRGG